jgi:hypothetical protein
MKKELRYCPMCKKSETRDECSYGPKIWDILSLKESTINEGRVRRPGVIPTKASDALLALAFIANAAQSREHFVATGKIESPGVALMQRWSRPRGEAERNLDSGRVSHPSRNIKDPPDRMSGGRRRKKTISIEPKIFSTIGEGRVHSNSNMYPLNSGWNPDEKLKAKMKSLHSKVFGTSPDPASVERYKKLLSAYTDQQNTKPPLRSDRHMSRLERLHGINIGRVRRQGVNSQERLMPSRFKELPQNKNRNKFYRGNLSGQPKPLGEELDKKTLMMLVIQKIMNEKKRKNYLLNYGYIGEAKTPAWSRSEGKDLKKGGLNRKGIASYRRQHPGSKLSMAVTTEPSKLKKGSKKWKRRKSFCSRMLGMRRKLTSAKTARDPNSRINLSLKKWNC